ncbi:sugar kinase [Microbacterium marinum]|uniref:sugar kinase n=1 Tax=Microbacterium marinum TaxID=421115 RepID=UPI00384D141A
MTIGETMGLATSARVGSLMHDRSFDLSFGGAESNVAVGLSRLGISATWVSRLGEDSIGDLIRRELRAEGVRVVAETDRLAPTGFMLKERRSAERTNVMFYRRGSAASTMGVREVAAAPIEDAALLHLTGIFPALSESTRQATFSAIERAGNADVPVSFDLNFRSKLWSADTASAVFRQIVPSCSVVFAGVEEAQLLFPDLDAASDLAHALVDLGCQEAVIKQGSDGCTAFIDGQDYRVPARRVHVVDTVGAGDAFVAGYLSEWVTGQGPEQRLALAVITGALACSVAGDWEGAPRAAELLSIDDTEGVSR